jgi:thiamine-monophosphate kinase
VSTGEQAIIELLLGGPLRPDRKLQQPGDDAVVTPGGALVSVDAMVEGVHFDESLSAADVGWKLAAVNASDISACGRLPRWALLSLSLPRDDTAWLSGFAQGLQEALRRWDITLLGGDTTRSPGPRFASLTIGSGPSGPVVSRAGARVGDELWVTGELGRAAAGFCHGTAGGLVWLRRPEPPVVFGARLGEAGLAMAMMDLSDGLRADLARLCAASGVGAWIDPTALPAGPALPAVGAEERLALMTSFGEDYELLFAAPASAHAAVVALGEESGVRLSCVGRCVSAGDGVRLGGGCWPSARFAHF